MQTLGLCDPQSPCVPSSPCIPTSPGNPRAAALEPDETLLYDHGLMRRAARITFAPGLTRARRPFSDKGSCAPRLGSMIRFPGATRLRSVKYSVSQSAEGTEEGVCLSDDVCHCPPALGELLDELRLHCSRCRPSVRLQSSSLSHRDSRVAFSARLRCARGIHDGRWIRPAIRGRQPSLLGDRLHAAACCLRLESEGIPI